MRVTGCGALVIEDVRPPSPHRHPQRRRHLRRQGRDVAGGADPAGEVGLGGLPQGRIGERHHPETHAIPLALQTALGQRQGFKLFGDDYDTRDGTAVRDYVHVMDLADAHVRALKYLLDGGETTVFNLGAGAGTTVRELIDTIRRTTNRPFPVETAPRRPGDAPRLVADNSRAREVLGWRPARTLDDIVRTAWRWHAAEREAHEA